MTVFANVGTGKLVSVTMDRKDVEEANTRYREVSAAILVLPAQTAFGRGATRRVVVGAVDAQIARPEGTKRTGAIIRSEIRG